MSGFRLGTRSLKRLEPLHDDLQRVVHGAIRLTTVDFAVLEGFRTRERQLELVKKGASKTMNSRHLTGHAVDLGAWIDDEVSWAWPPYYEICSAMKSSAEQLHIPLEWGGDWPSFRDGPHFQLPWKEYPA